MILLISDLHLDVRWPQISERFYGFLDEIAETAEALYILGDFFEVWIGDDDDNPHYQALLARIAKLTTSGVAVYIMHGNRDFLFGETAAARAGMQLIHEPLKLTLPDGKPALLCHGDALCTDDHAYQAFRQTVRGEAWQNEFLAKPLDERRAIVRQLRERSEQGKQSKADYLMDVNQASVETLMQAHNVQRLIHGHTHRLAKHDFLIGKQASQRWVLGDWHAERGGSYLRCDTRGCKLLAYEN